jgi:predicted Zn-dependent peptidase
MVFRNLDVTQVDLALGLRAYPIRHPRYPAEAVLCGILGGGPASRLFETVREDRGLVYDIRADVETFRDVGAMTITTTCGEANLEPTLNGVFDVLDEVVAAGVTEEELHRSREMTRAAADYLLDAPFDLADWYGRVQLLDEPEHLPDPRHEAERYLAVTMDDVRGVVGDLLRPTNRYLGVIGPVHTRQKRRLEEIFRRRTGSGGRPR